MADEVTRYGQIIERELNPNHGSAMVDKVNRLVALHEENPDHPHRKVET
jgi:hypothetical protein